MSNAFQKLTSEMPELFERLNNSPVFNAKGIASQEKRPGVYVFLENGNPVHVGRTRNLKNRLRGHISRNHNSASFAFKRTRYILKKFATYVALGSRGDLLSDEVFATEFYQQISHVKAMDVRFLELNDPIKQYLLELYAHLEYGLPLDEFDTH